MTKHPVTQSPKFQRWAYEIIPHIILIGYCVIALYPIILRNAMQRCLARLYYQPG